MLCAAEFWHSLGVSPQKGSAETIGSAAGEDFPLRLPSLGAPYVEAMAFEAA